MKSICIGIFTALVMIPWLASAWDEPGVEISDLSIEGRIEGENIVFTMNFNADVQKKNACLPLISGNVAFLDCKLPRRVELSRDGDRFFMTFRARRTIPVAFTFASLPVKDGDWRQTGFTIPMSNVRRLAVICDRDDLEVIFPGALDVEKHKNEEGQTVVTAFLGSATRFDVRWKPEVKKLDAELTVTCDANTIAAASVGALGLDNVFTYRLVQGRLQQIILELPGNVSITEVVGADIQDWKIEDKTEGNRSLIVRLSRPCETTYRLQVKCEMVLPEFPCEISLPVLIPKGVIRTSGFLMVGTDSSIKLIVNRMTGLSQIDQTSFPAVRPKEGLDKARTIPSRTAFAYQYANMPYTVLLKADDIVSEYNAQDRLILSVEDNDLVLNASVELDVRDAPAREIAIETAPDWTVANVAGKAISDHDVRDKDGIRTIHLYFHSGILGRTLIDVRMERSLGTNETSFSVPCFKILGAKTERGYLVLTAEKGLRLKTEESKGLREVHTGSLPMSVPGAQQAFRFREPGWAATMAIEWTEPTVHSEIFNLLSIGDGVIYGSASITYHISGAPLRCLKLNIPQAIQDVEFTGRDIRVWKHEGAEWIVSLQEKIIGDYTLLVTYDQQIDYDQAELMIGGIETVGTESEVGYIVLTSDANLNVSELEIPSSIIRIDREEIPQSYALLINDPVISAYKYIRPPHAAKIRISRYETEPLLDQILDHTSLSTSMTEDGESVTKVTYFIKNASQQYLSVSLPQGTRLWSTRHMDEEGKMVEVAPLKGKKATLIPVGRPRDPNIPLQVEIVYAQSVDRIGPLGSRLKLEAPVSRGTPSTFARWTVNAPADFEVRAMTGGNMAPDTTVSFSGLEMVAVNVLRLWQGALRWLIFALALAIALGVILFNVARGSGMVRGGILAVVLLVAGLILTLFIPEGPEHMPDVFRSIRAFNGASKVSFTRTLSLKGSGPLTVQANFSPMWLGAGVSPVFCLLSGLIGIVLSVKVFFSKRKNLFLASVGLTLLAVGASGLAIVRSMLTVGLAIAVPLGLIGWMLIAFWLWGRKQQINAEVNAFDDQPFGSGEAASYPADKEQESGQTENNKGFSTGCGIILMLSMVMSAALVLAKSEQAETARVAMSAPVQIKTIAPLKTPVMKTVELSVECPGLSKDDEKSAKVTGEFIFSTSGPVTFTLLNSFAVVTDFDLSSKHLQFRSQPEGYILNALRKGDYRVTLKYLVPVTEQRGLWSVTLGIPPNLKNKVILRLPEKQLDISSNEAVYLTSEEKEERGTEVTAVFGSAPVVRLNWRPRVRKTKLEKVVFFCEVNTFALFKPGVVDLTNLVRFQIAQGEIKEIIMLVHEGMSVTSVTAPGLSTWRFDPETHQLEAVLEKPVSGDFILTVITQIPREGLPYKAVIGALTVKDADRQRGCIALAVPETVQIKVDKLVGLSAMNITDFSQEAIKAAGRKARTTESTSIKRAFRFQQLPVSASVQAEKVLPELKVTEKGTLSISDERIVLSSQLDITIAKSGVFSVRLDIPKDFDIETLSGKGISHWDEIKDDGHGVVVHFQKQVLGAQRLNVVIARMEKGIEKTIMVPKVEVRDAKKHTGTLVISGERSVRMTTVKREGVSELNPSDLGIRETGVIAFKLLRPEWQVILKTEVLSPTIKPEVLQRIDLAEGMLYGTVFIRYAIENAGCKIFRLQAPEPGTSLAITGRNIAKVFEKDREKGIWQVVLNNKVEQNMLLRVSYQIPFDPAQRKVNILPLKTLDTEGQKGYLVVMSAKRVQIKPEGDLTGLKPEDSRSIPPAFGAGDMSDAILSFRAVLPDYQLPLNVIRHGSEAVLPAKVNQVHITSVVSEDGQMLTRVGMDINVGDMRFLKIRLPDPHDTLWSVFVNGKVAKPSRDDKAHRIPLEESIAGDVTLVDIVYAGRADSIRFWRRQTYKAPEFNLPLNNVEWNLYVRPGLLYYGFDGTCQFQEQDAITKGLNERNYTIDNLRQIQADLAKARVVMAKGEQYAQEGKQKQARQALETAMNYSQSKADFNEDARIQYRNLVKQQAFIGLVQRRNEVRSFQNIRDEKQVRKMDGFQSGNFTPEYARQIEQSLPAEENTNLQTLAEKIIDQQAAAAALAQAIRITVPEQGTRLMFLRPLQINPNAEMSVSFKAIGAGPLVWLKSLWPMLMLLVLFRVILGIIQKNARSDSASKR